ncbi:MAG TPA: histidine kinase dimerization/phospho-acceptor domain-containing protein, partial [Longimicrobiales bacterium]|nr:histidine kinase dimerization/phospho-acceptor domain-containing protein [Longimicrobiales bacterium]
HEIKNPLNAIFVNLEVLRRRVENNAPAAAIERADVIEHEIRRVHSLVDQLLQLMRPGRGDAGPLAVDGVIDALTTVIQLQGKAAQVIVGVETESNLYAQVKPEPFKFALLNVLMYAIDRSLNDGSVSLRARRGSDDVRIEVSTSHAVLQESDQHLRHCSALMLEAGGHIEFVEPQAPVSGSTIALVMPPARFS